MIAVYEHARRQCGRAGFLAAREEATIASLSDILGDVDVTGTVAVLRRGAEAADSCGRALFSGLNSLDWPDDPVGQLWRTCDLLREHRGHSHMAVWIAAGLGPVAVNLLTELWLGMPLGAEITPAGRAFRDQLEDRTDALEQPVVDAMGEDFEPVVQALDTWSTTIAASGAFPPGTYRSA